MKFIGKNVLITGATGSLGTSVTNFFRLEGANVTISYQSRLKLNQLLNLSNIDAPVPFACRADLTEEKEVIALFSAAIKEFGSVDILCNLVGAYMPATPIAELTVKAWERMFAANCRTAFILTKHAVPVMAKHRFGRIIHMAAYSALSPEAGRGAYGTSKAALCYFTKVAAAEVKAISRKDITVNAIAPSVIAVQKNMRSRATAQLPRTVSHKQIIDLISFLASESSSAVNGEIISLVG